MRSVASRVRVLVEDRVLTAPNPFFRPVFTPDDRATVDRAVKAIQATACWQAETSMPRDLCSAISERIGLAFQGQCPGIRTKVNERTGVGHMLNPLRLHPALVAFATNPLLLGIIEQYLRRRIFLSDVDVRRVPPITMQELDQRAGTKAVGYTSSHWHRDIRGRQVKIMVYLTDVGEHDSNFAYYPGSHRSVYVRPAHFEESRMTDEQAAKFGGAIECYGPAGTALVFDTNALHRLRRKPTAKFRDSVTYYYTPGQELRSLDVGEEALKQLPDEVRAIFGGAHRPA